MRGLGPRIHVLLPMPKTWMAGTEAGHDGKGELRFSRGMASFLGCDLIPDGTFEPRLELCQDLLVGRADGGG